MYCVVTRNKRQNANFTHHQHQSHFSNVVIQRKTRQSQGTIGDNLQKSNAIAVRKQEIMWEIDHHQNSTLALDHNHYRLESP